MNENLYSLILICAVILLGIATTSATEPIIDKTDLFEEQTNGFMLYRIP